MKDIMKDRMIQIGMPVVLGVLLVGGTVPVANGMLILGQDNFDNVAVGALPSPQVGTYGAGSALVGTGIVTATSSPNYLDNHRDDGGGIFDYGYALDLVGPPVGLSTNVHVELQNYVVSSSGVTVMGLAGSETPADYWTSTILYLGTSVTAGGRVDAYGPSGWKYTGLNYSVDTWQKWEIDYVVGAPGFNLSVDGVSVSLDSTFMVDPAATQVAVYYLDSGGTPSHNLVDDVLVMIPEPSSITMVGLGVLVAFIRRRR